MEESKKILEPTDACLEYVKLVIPTFCMVEGLEEDLATTVKRKLIEKKGCDPSSLNEEDYTEIQNEVQELMGKYSEEAIETILDRYCNWYNNGNLNSYAESYNEFSTNEEILNTLKTYNLDKEKFWTLAVFTANFANSSFTEDTRKETKTTYEIAQDLYGILTPNNGTTLTVTSEKGKYTCNDIWLNIGLQKLLLQIINSPDKYNTRNLYFANKDEFRTAKLKLFVRVLMSFLTENYPEREPSKMSFIAKFAYLMRYTENEVFLNGYNPTPLPPNPKYFKDKYGTVTLGGKEYYKAPVDTGKQLADTIKNNTIKPSIDLSNFCYNPIPDTL